MERLRIKLPGEGFDLRLVDDVRPTGEALTDKEIVKKEPLVRNPARWPRPCRTYARSDSGVTSRVYSVIQTAHSDVDQRRIQGDLCVHQLRNWTAGLGLPSKLLNFRLVRARYLGFQVQMDGCDGISRRPPGRA